MLDYIDSYEKWLGPIEANANPETVVSDLGITDTFPLAC